MFCFFSFYFNYLFDIIYYYYLLLLLLLFMIIYDDDDYYYLLLLFIIYLQLKSSGSELNSRIPMFSIPCKCQLWTLL